MCMALSCVPGRTVVLRARREIALEIYYRTWRWKWKCPRGDEAFATPKRFFFSRSTCVTYTILDADRSQKRPNVFYPETFSGRGVVNASVIRFVTCGRVTFVRFHVCLPHSQLIISTDVRTVLTPLKYATLCHFCSLHTFYCCPSLG